MMICTKEQLATELLLHASLLEEEDESDETQEFAGLTIHSDDELEEHGMFLASSDEDEDEDDDYDDEDDDYDDEDDDFDDEDDDFDDEDEEEA